MLATLQVHPRQFYLPLRRPIPPPPIIIYPVFHTGIDILACSITQMEGHRGILFQQHLFLKIDSQGSLTVTQRQGECSSMTLAGSIRHICHHIEVKEQRMLTLWDNHRHLHKEGTVCLRHSLTAVHLFAVIAYAKNTHIIVAIERPPPEGHPAHHPVFHLGSLNGDACVCQGLATNLYRIASLVVLLYILKLHLEGGTLVLLHTEIVLLAIRIDAELSRQSRGRQREIDGTHAIGIGPDRLLLHLFPIGITQGDRHLFAYNGGMLVAFNCLIDHHCGVYRLSGTVDGPVGKDLRTFWIIVVLVIPVTVGSTQLRTGLVFVGIGKDLATPVVLALIQILTIGIRPYIRDIIFIIGFILLDTQVGIGDGLSCCGTDHHITGHIVGLTLCQGIDIRHEIELTDNLCRGTGGELQHIVSHGQALEGQGVLEDFVGLLACIDTFHLDGSLTQQGLDFLVARFITRTDINVSIGFHTIYFQRQ